MLIGRSLEILTLFTVLKNHEPVHVKHGKCNFVPRGNYSCMRTIKSMAIIAVASNFRHFSVHMLIGRSLEILNFFHGVEKSRARAREARKMQFCTQRQLFVHAHYKRRKVVGSFR